MEKIPVARNHEIVLEFGGLRCEVYYTNNFGASMRVFAAGDGSRTELLRFDDFVDTPHYHAPADDPNQIDLDVAASGEPREFFLNVLANELPKVLPAAGFPAVVDVLDLDEVQRHLPAVRAAMDTVLVEGFHRVQGTSLQDSDQHRPGLRDEANARFAARLQALAGESRETAK